MYEAEDPSVISVAGRYGEGVEFFVPEPKNENHVSQLFLKNFTKRFGYHPGVLARNAYINTRLAAYATLACKMDLSCLRNFMINSDNTISIVGNF